MAGAVSDRRAGRKRDRFEEGSREPESRGPGAEAQLPPGIMNAYTVHCPWRRGGAAGCAAGCLASVAVVLHQQVELRRPRNAGKQGCEPTCGYGIA